MDTIRIGTWERGPLDAITDVAGVRVGHVTLIHDEPRVARTGVTAIHPLATPYWEENVFAGFHRFNGFGEMCGTHWIAETGLLSSPIVLTSSYSLGVARDALFAHPFAAMGEQMRFHHPLCGETNDVFLNDGLARHVTHDHVWQALDTAQAGPFEQGSVGGGTGMVAFGFKGGIGTSSRVVRTPSGRFTVGVLAQTNFGSRAKLTVAGQPVGELIGADLVPLPQFSIGGSVVVVVATDAPLLPAQCNRLAQRSVVGLGRTGAIGGNTSGDFVVAFSTANTVPPFADAPVSSGRMLPNMHMNPLFEGVIEATESAVLHSMLHSRTMTGVHGRTVHALPIAMLREKLAECRGGQQVAT